MYVMSYDEGKGVGAEGRTSKGYLYCHSESMGFNVHVSMTTETIIIICPLQWCCPTMTMHIAIVCGETAETEKLIDRGCGGELLLYS